MNREEKQQLIKEIVKANLSRVSTKAILHIGGHGSFTRDEILKEVENETDIGKKMIDAELEYIQIIKQLYANTPNY